MKKNMSPSWRANMSCSPCSDSAWNAVAIRRRHSHRLGRIVLYSIFLLCLLSSVSEAGHFPWDQGHDATKWNDPSDLGPCSESTCDPCNSTRSPVYIPTGHFIWSDTDVVLRGRPPLGITRTYNSHDPRDGLFGNGWSATCDMGLYKVRDSGNNTQYVLRVSNGKRYTYVESAPGDITPPPGIFDRIIPQDNGSNILEHLDGSRHVFRPDGNLETYRDRNGNFITYEYTSDRLKRITDGHNSALTFQYNSRGRVSEIADQTGRSWRYEYDGEGNLIKVTNPSGGTRQYHYTAYVAEADGQTYYHLSTILDGLGIVVSQITYIGERVSTYTAAENTFTYTYDVVKRIVTKTDAVGSSWEFTYDAAGLITKEMDPLHGVVTHSYDTNGREIQRTDELSKTWILEYDSLGRITTRTNPLNEKTQLHYGGTTPWPIKMTSPTGRITELVYDSKGNLLKVKDPAGAISELQWNSTGDLKGIVDRLEKLTKLKNTSTGKTSEIFNLNRLRSLS